MRQVWSTELFFWMLLGDSKKHQCQNRRIQDHSGERETLYWVNINNVEFEIWSIVTEICNRRPIKKKTNFTLLSRFLLCFIFILIFSLLLPSTFSSSSLLSPFPSSFLFPSSISYSPHRLKDGAESFKKFVIRVSFVYTKQPLRIAQVLRQVYPVDPTNVDDELVER